MIRAIKSRRTLALLALSATFSLPCLLPSSNSSNGGGSAFAADVNPTEGRNDAVAPASRPAGRQMMKPKNPEAAEEYEKFYKMVTEGRYPEARQKIDRVIELEPEVLQWQMDRVEVLLAMRNGEAALERLKDINNHQKGQNPVILARIGQVYYQMKQTTYAQNALEEALRVGVQTDPKNPFLKNVRKDLLNIYLQSGNTMKASTLAGDWCRMYPEDPDNHNDFGVVLTRLGDLVGARASFKKVVELNPKHVDGLYNYGLALYQNWNLTEAEKHFRAAIALAPKYLDAWLVLGRTLMREGRYTEAESVFNTVIKEKPDLADALYEVGMAQLKLGKSNSAIDSFEQALRHNAYHPEAKYQHGLAMLRVKKERPDLALADFLGAAQGRPKDPEIYYQIAHCYKRMGSQYIDQSIANFREALWLRPNWPEAMNDLSWLLATHPDEKVRNATEARDLAQKAYDSTSGRRPLLLDSLAAAEAAGGNFDEAVKLQQKAIDMANTDPDQRLAAQLVKELEPRLASYKAKKPWTQDPVTARFPAATTRPADKVAGTAEEKGK